MGGLRRYIGHSFQYDWQQLYSMRETYAKAQRQSRNLFGILEAKDGSIWFGSSDGVYRYDRNTIKDFKGKDGEK
jgi:hypothetical protein